MGRIALAISPFWETLTSVPRSIGAKSGLPGFLPVYRCPIYLVSNGKHSQHQ